MDRITNKKTLATILSWIFALFLVVIVGVSFSTFGYANKKITIDKVDIKATGVFVVDNKGETIRTLQFNAPLTGLKPVTGEEDSCTKIPYTVTEAVGSEGAYSSFTIKSNKSYKIQIVNISVEGLTNLSELENIKIAIKGSDREACDLSSENVVLYEGNETSDSGQKFLIYVWLCTHAGDELVGCKINFDLKIG